MNQPVSNVNYSVATGGNSNNTLITQIFARDPTPNDINFNVTQRWVNKVSGNEWFLVGFTSFSGDYQANWINLSSGNTSNLNTLTSNSGGVINPTSNNINVVGDGTTITGVGDPSTSTITLSVLPIDQSKLILIQTQFASSAAHIIFTSLPSASFLLLKMANVLPSTNGSSLEIYASQDNGVTYLSSNYLIGTTYNSISSTLMNNVNSSSYGAISGSCSSNSYDPYFSELNFYTVAQASTCNINGIATWTDTVESSVVMGRIAGSFPLTGINAIKLQFSSGNIAGGQFSLYQYLT
jgi:hypothetical protein